MVDSASSMECRNCKSLLHVEAFWEHVASGVKCAFSPLSGIDALKSELREVKEKYERLKEGSAETEVSLKTEIKYLLSKLMQFEPDERALKSLPSNHSKSVSALAKAQGKPTVRLKGRGNENNNVQCSVSRTMEGDVSKRSSVDRLSRKSLNMLRRNTEDITEQTPDRSINLPRMYCCCVISTR